MELMSESLGELVAQMPSKVDADVSRPFRVEKGYKKHIDLILHNLCRNL